MDVAIVILLNQEDNSPQPEKKIIKSTSSENMKVWGIGVTSVIMLQPQKNTFMTTNSPNMKVWGIGVTRVNMLQP